jgi:hypothetical protein
MNGRGQALWLSAIVAGLVAPGIATAAALPDVVSQVSGSDTALTAPDDLGGAGSLNLIPDSGTAAAGDPQASVNETGEVRVSRSEAHTSLAARGAVGPRGRPDATGGDRANRPARAGSRPATAAREDKATLADRRPHKQDRRTSPDASPRPHAKVNAAPRPDPASDARTEEPGALPAVGREVGNPIQLNLAAWLLLMTGAATIGASRLVRHLQRSRL